MNSKINRIDTEIAKTRQKISGLQANIRELEQQKTELENTDIVGLVRGSGMTAQELTAVLQAFREKSGVPFSTSKQEDIGNEK